MDDPVSKKDLDEMKSLVESRLNECLEKATKIAEEKAIAAEKRADEQERIIQNLKEQIAKLINPTTSLSGNNLNGNGDDTSSTATSNSVKRRIIYDTATFVCCLFRLIFSGIVYFAFRPERVFLTMCPFRSIIKLRNELIWLWYTFAQMILSLIAETQVGRLQRKISIYTYILYLQGFILIIIASYQVWSRNFEKIFTIGWGIVATAQLATLIQLAQGNERPKVLIFSYLLAVISSIFIAIEQMEVFSLFTYPLHALHLCWGLPVVQEVPSTDDDSTTAVPQGTAGNERPKVLIFSYLFAVISSIFIAIEQMEVFSLFTYPLHALHLCWGLPVVQEVPSTDDDSTTAVPQGTANLQQNPDVAVSNTPAIDVENIRSDSNNNNNNQGNGQQNNISFAARNLMSRHLRHDDHGLKEELEHDVYSMMMLTPWKATTISFGLCYKHKDTIVDISFPNISWITGLSTFIIQFGLGLLIIDQSNKAEFGTDFNIPVRVDFVVIIGQFMSVIVALMIQTDILVSFRVIALLWYKKGDNAKWKKVIGEQNDSFSLWCYRIFLPNILKILQGIVILITSFIIIIQSSDIVILLKDFTALFVISSVDNIIFMVADNGYLGVELSDKANEVKSKDLDETEKEKHITCYWLQVKFAVIVLVMLVGWLYIRIRQSKGYYTEYKYPLCKEKANTTVLNPYLGDGVCQARFFNLQCGWDHGDCPNFSEDSQFSFPNCNVSVPSRLGNGFCDGGVYNTEECGWDDGDCALFKYPDCTVEFTWFIGNGECDHGDYNTFQCGWDGGDCLDEENQNSTLQLSLWIHNEFYDDGAYKPN